MRNRLRQLDPLPHPLAVSADPLVPVIQHADTSDRFLSTLRGLGGAIAMYPQKREDEIPAGEVPPEGVRLGAVADRLEEPVIVPCRLAVYRHIALARFQLTRHQAQECRFAGAVRPEKTGDAGPHGERAVVDTDHLAVPF